MRKKLFLFISFVCFLGCKEKEWQNILGHVNPIKTDLVHPHSSDRDTQSEDVTSVELVSCEKYCHKNHFEDLDDDGYSYLAFTNFGYRGVGRCRGHALLTQKMSILASFRESGGCDLQTKECIQIYREGIQKIKKFKYHRFQGFKNLYEFSSHPKIKKLLKAIVAGTSNRYKAGRGFIKNPIYDSKELNTFHELKRRLSLGHLPYVGVLGRLTGAHALVLYADTFQGGQNILCARDPNFKNSRMEDCENYFFEQEANIYFQRLGKKPDKMYRFSLTKDEDIRIKRYMSALTKNCIEVSLESQLCN
jgi:hypothetical protein